SRDGKYLCGATTQYSNTVWDMDADTLYKTFTKEKLGNYYGIINFSPDNQYLLFGGGGLFRDSNRTQIWDFINDTSIYYSGIHSASGIDYSINGKYLLLADHTKLFLLTPNKSITGINELPNEYLNALYPNPAGDFLNINSANIIGKNIDIFDMLGNKLMSVVAESTETRINIGTLPTGVYMIKNSELTKLFLKK
ncbi:MAG: T9SS type A sorting domain-containing protein, partial [FCB group bacterium]